MDIPIQNIYYMLCYAWDKLRERDIVNVNSTDCDNIEDLFAKVLTAGISHLLKKGLDRSYVAHNEETETIRGRIDFATTLKRTFFRLPKVYCEYDDLSYNILHNQILKSTIRNLMRFDGISKDNKEKLQSVYRLLPSIDCIDISPKTFRKVQLHSNNYFYDFLLCICELICLRTLPSEEAGRYKFRDFHRDKGMPGLFEAFIRNFYKQELKNAQFVGREKIKWDGAANDDASQQVLPEMNTDISIKINDRKIIIEAKYYQEPMQKNRYDEKKLVSGNLYQLFAYLMNSEGNDKLDKTCEGILLYPVVEMGHSYEYTIKGHRMAIKTINLNQKWKQIENDLLDLIILAPHL